MWCPVSLQVLSGKSVKTSVTESLPAAVITSYRHSLNLGHNCSVVSTSTLFGMSYESYTAGYS